MYCASFLKALKTFSFIILFQHLFRFAITLVMSVIFKLVMLLIYRQVHLLGKILHDTQRRASVTITKVIPVVQVVKKLVYLLPLCKSISLWDFLMVSVVKGAAKAAEHAGDG